MSQENVELVRRALEAFRQGKIDAAIAIYHPSGAEVEVPETWVFTFRGGKVAQVREYRTTEEALEAVGL